MIDIHRLSGRMGNEMFRDAYIYSQMREGNIPDVYVQDPKYFEKYKDEIKKRYSEGIGYLPYVGVHLRVGGNPIDPSEPKYMDNPFYTSLINTGYYIKAIEKFDKDWKFLIFSDDMDAAKFYFTGGDRFVFDEPSGGDIEAFNRFASCHHKILANSSWSWWAGYLSNMLDAKIICPPETSWYADGIVRTKVPKDWEQLPL